MMNEFDYASFTMIRTIFTTVIHIAIATSSLLITHGVSSTPRDWDPDVAGVINHVLAYNFSEGISVRPPFRDTLQWIGHNQYWDMIVTTTEEPIEIPPHRRRVLIEGDVRSPIMAHGNATIVVLGNLLSSIELHKGEVCIAGDVADTGRISSHGDCDVFALNCSGTIQLRGLDNHILIDGVFGGVVKVSKGRAIIECSEYRSIARAYLPGRVIVRCDMIASSALEQLLTSCQISYVLAQKSDHRLGMFRYISRMDERQHRLELLIREGAEQTLLDHDEMTEVPLSLFVAGDGMLDAATWSLIVEHIGRVNGGYVIGMGHRLFADVDILAQKDVPDDAISVSRGQSVSMTELTGHVHVRQTGQKWPPAPIVLVIGDVRGSLTVTGDGHIVVCGNIEEGATIEVNADTAIHRSSILVTGRVDGMISSTGSIYVTVGQSVQGKIAASGYMRAHVGQTIGGLLLGARGTSICVDEISASSELAMLLPMLMKTTPEELKIRVKRADQQRVSAGVQSSVQGAGKEKGSGVVFHGRYSVDEVKRISMRRVRQARGSGRRSLAGDAAGPCIYTL